MIDTDKKILEHIKAVSEARGNGNFNNMLPIADVKIPGNITIKCPLERSTIHRASKCHDCHLFRGVAQTTWSDDADLRFDSKYTILCGYPIERKCSCLHGE